MANAVAALPVVVGKKAGTVDGAPAPVAKASKECSLASADIAAPAKVVAAPAPVTKATGPIHLTGVVVEIVGTEAGDRVCSCEEHPNNCGEVLAEDVVVHLCEVQIQVEGQEEMAIAAYWVTDGIDCCRVGFLPRHMIKQAGRYDGALAQVTHVLMRIQPAATQRNAVHFIKIEGVAMRQ